MSASASSQWRSLLQSSLAQLRTRSAPLVTVARTRGGALARKWGGAVVVGSAAYFLIDPSTREQWWAAVRARSIQPWREWRENKAHGERKRILLAHFGIVRGGDVLELFPGAGHASFGVMDALAAPAGSTRVSTQWRGLDTQDAAWKAGQIEAAAGEHAALPKSLLAFDSCSARGKSLYELLKEVPDNSVSHVLALQGLSPLFTAAPTSLASLTRRPPNPLNSAPPPSRDAELASLLREIVRVLRPGGHFVFVEEAERNKRERFMHTLQTSLAALRERLPGSVGARTPIDLLQQLPTVPGWSSLHLEQWPARSQQRHANPRAGVRILRHTLNEGVPEEERDDFYTDIAGLSGLRPLVAGVATKEHPLERPRAAKPPVLQEYVRPNLPPVD